MSTSLKVVGSEDRETTTLQITGGVVPMEIYDRPSEDRLGERTNSVTNTVFLLLADIVGTGILSLPYAFSQVGWLGGLFLLFLCFPLNLYAGVLLSRLHLYFPQARTYGEVGGLVAGKWGARAGYGLLYFSLFLCMGNYLIVLTKSLQAIFYRHHFCRPIAGLVAMVMLMIPNSMRTLHGASQASIISILTICIAVVIAMVYVFDGEALADLTNGLAEVETPALSKSADFWTWFSTLSSFVFAMSGQSIYLEMMTEMKNPREFPKALYVALPAMLVVYLFVCLGCYFTLGTYTPDYLMDVLSWDGVKVGVNVLMLIHMLISYAIRSQVLNRAIHLWWDFKAAHTMDMEERGYWRARAQWFVITTLIMILAWTASNVVPFFDDLVDLTGSLCTGPLGFMLPSLFYLLAVKVKGEKISTMETTLCAFMLAFSVLLLVLGTISNVRDIVADEEAYGKPFTCHCESHQCVLLEK